MFQYLKDRYSDKATALRALAHAEACGLITAFFSRFGCPLAFVFALSGVGVELWQWKHDLEYDVKDGICDACEWLIGGLVFGSIFYFLR